MFGEDFDQAVLFPSLRAMVGDDEEEIGLAAAPVRGEKLAGERNDLGEVETVDVLGKHSGEELAKVLGVLKGLPDDLVGEVAGKKVGWFRFGHRGSPGIEGVLFACDAAATRPALGRQAAGARSPYFYSREAFGPSSIARLICRAQDSAAF